MDLLRKLRSLRVVAGEWDNESDENVIESIREAHITPAGNVQSFQYSRFERIR